MLVKLIMKVLSNLLGNGSKIKYTEIGVQKDNEILNIKEYIDSGEVYSTSEVKTNKVWIDGKPIYRTVVYASNLATAAQFSSGIANRDTWISLNFAASIGNKSGDVQFHNTYTSSSNFARAFLSYSDTEIRWRSATAGMYAYFILEYTKTTD